MSWNITGAPGTGEDLLYSQAGTPTLDLRFASSKNLNDYVSGQNLITYTRAGDATFFDANGTIQTAGANTPRFDHNPATGESLGLLIEEARTNLLLNSETLATQSVTVTAAAHTLSFYGTGTVTLSGTHSATVVGTGAFPTRTTLTFTPTSGSLTVTVSGTVQYAQVELGAFATSWISTAGSTATRNADVAQITGTNFSRWYSQSAGTVFAEYKNVPSTIGGISRRIVSFSDGTTSNQISLRWHNSTVGGNYVVFAGGTLSVNITGNVSTTSRAAAVFKLNDYAIARDGEVPSVNTSAPVPTVSAAYIGLNADGATTSAAMLNGAIKRIAYFDRRLPNATLQAITA
jgi:hypothetical protein